jgi:signal transduction histidine kinase
VSHEFRTPITVLKTISDMGGLEPEVQEMQASALSRLEHLVNSVLLLNELNANGVQLARTIMDVRSWVHSQVSPILARHGKFELHTHLPACSLELDWVKLGTALESVVDNAVKFGGGDRSGQVSIYLSTRSHLQTRRREVGMRFDGLDIGLLMPPAEVDPHDPDALLVIEVKDRGIGIPPEELETVFQPFTQAANSPTRGVKGAGLGLAMVRSIVAAQGGEILCRSAVDHGTIVTMVLPIGNLPAEFAASTSQPHASV